jgi:hypothetical protein
VGGNWWVISGGKLAQWKVRWIISYINPPPSLYLSILIWRNKIKLSICSFLLYQWLSLFFSWFLYQWHSHLSRISFPVLGIRSKKVQEARTSIYLAALLQHLTTTKIAPSSRASFRAWASALSLHTVLHPRWNESEKDLLRRQDQSWELSKQIRRSDRSREKREKKETGFALRKERKERDELGDDPLGWVTYSLGLPFLQHLQLHFLSTQLTIMSSQGRNHCVDLGSQDPLTFKKNQIY